jgi:monoterpene epsilon-lactone hydrolase
MGSKELERLIGLIEQVRGVVTEPNVEALRASFEQIASMTKIPKDAKCEPLNIEGVPSEWISVPESINDRVILYLHGGGYVAGSINSHREFGVRLARASRSIVLIIDYRLAPEYCFPAPLEDAIKVYKWLIFSEGIKSKQIIIAGESAGGGLTIATLLKLRDDQIELPAAGVCLSPFLDLTVSGESIKTKAEMDPLTTEVELKSFAKLYLRDEDFRNPLASPLFADLKNIPPLYIQVGTRETLLDDSIRFADLAKSAGVDVKLDIWDDMIHMFQMFATMLPEGQKAIDKIGEFILKSLE